MQIQVNPSIFQSNCNDDGFEPPARGSRLDWSDPTPTDNELKIAAINPEVMEQLYAFNNNNPRALTCVVPTPMWRLMDQLVLCRKKCYGTFAKHDHVLGDPWLQPKNVTDAPWYTHIDWNAVAKTAERAECPIAYLIPWFDKSSEEIATLLCACSC